MSIRRRLKKTEQTDLQENFGTHLEEIRIVYTDLIFFDHQQHIQPPLFRNHSELKMK